MYTQCYIYFQNLQLSIVQVQNMRAVYYTPFKNIFYIKLILIEISICNTRKKSKATQEPKRLSIFLCKRYLDIYPTHSLLLSGPHSDPPIRCFRMISQCIFGLQLVVLRTKFHREGNSPHKLVVLVISAAI